MGIAADLAWGHYYKNIRVFTYITSTNRYCFFSFNDAAWETSRIELAKRDFKSYASRELMPSVNLSHAVAVVLSHIFKQVSALSVDTAASVAPSESTDAPTNSSFNVILADDFHNLSRRLKEALQHSEAAGRVANAERLARILSQTLVRANLDSSEMAAWHGLISAINS